MKNAKKIHYDPKLFVLGQKFLSKKDPGLKKLLKEIKLEFEPRMERSPYESLIRAIAHQQLHGKAAETILGRFFALFPGKKFPLPEAILKIEDETMRVCGFSNSKTKSIKDIALKASQGLIPDKKNIHQMSNEEIIEALIPIYGVGKWTVEMLLIFQLGRLDVWPVDDFGVRKGHQLWKRKKNMLTAKELKPVGEAFAPYQSIVALLMWRVADRAKEKK